MFPAHLLDIYFEQVVSEHGAIARMEVGAHCTDAAGKVSKGALAVLADVSMAAAVRGHVGKSVRIATMSMRLSFNQLPHEGLLRSLARVQFLRRDVGMLVAVVALHMQASAGEVCCVGEGTFAVLENKQGTANHPLPIRSTLTGSLEPIELDRAERVVWQRALECEAPAGALERFWDLDLNAQAVAPEGEYRVAIGKHNSNRVGHLQGGIVAGLLANACLHASNGPVDLVDISVQYQEPVSGGQANVWAFPMRLGRNAAFINASILSPEDRLLASAQCNLVKRLT